MEQDRGHPDGPTIAPGAPAACRVGTAGWAIPRAVADAFPAAGSGLERYDARFPAVEVNSTFYRRHLPDTYRRWAATTPSHFRFSVKLPKAITHEARLVNALDLAASFRSDVAALGEKLGPLLVQLPPSLAFTPAIAEPFFSGLRRFWPGTIVCEPRHASWFDAEADALLAALSIGRVAADPVRHPAGAAPAGWKGVSYWRLHGAPRMYVSAYDEHFLQALAAEVRAAPAESWCVFDNTASGAAAANALALLASL